MEFKTYEGYLDNGLFSSAVANVEKWGRVKVMMTLLEPIEEKPPMSHEEWVAEITRLQEESKDEILPDEIFLAKRQLMRIYDIVENQGD